MALGDLLAALEHEAEARIAADRAAAEAEATRLRAAALAATERRRAEITAQVRARLAEETGQTVAVATRRVQNAVLSSRERVVQRVLERVRQRCREDPGTGPGRETLVAFALAGLGYLETTPAVARGSPALLDALAARLDGGRPVRLVPDDTVGAGVRLESEDGRVTVDATLLGRLEHRQEEARTLVVRRLEALP